MYVYIYIYIYIYTFWLQHACLGFCWRLQIGTGLFLRFGSPPLSFKYLARGAWHLMAL